MGRVFAVPPSLTPALADALLPRCNGRSPTFGLLSRDGTRGSAGRSAVIPLRASGRILTFLRLSERRLRGRSASWRFLLPYYYSPPPRVRQHGPQKITGRLFIQTLQSKRLTNGHGTIIIFFVDCASGSRTHDAEWCNGNTNDSDSFILGSNPSSAATCLHSQEA